VSCEVVITKSGAPAMRDVASGEVMHPGTGPAVEPQELYVTPSRLRERLSEATQDRAGNLVLLDVGLGAASNAITAWRVSESLPRSARRLEIVSFENDLAALELALTPEHAASFGLTTGESDAHAAARSLLLDGRHETERTVWRLCLGDFPERIAAEPTASADLVYWDFYSAKTHPHLWSVSTLTALRRVCRPGATLHTYSTATSFRAALLLAGFAVGAGGRTGLRAETTIAAADVGDLTQPLGERWLQRLARSTLSFPADVASDPGARADAFARVRACPQFNPGPPR
jgi:tRNA U34 5-methylaminomethyl-2-thiouridine-forming methyltransferase MnmC